MSKLFHDMIYPEKRTVHEDVIIDWAHDMMKNAALKERTRGSPEPDFDANPDVLYDQIASEIPKPTAGEAKEYLSTWGLATFTS